MEFTFENHGTNTYLVYAVKPEDTIDTLSLGMLTNNKILGLAQTHFSQMDANKFIKYNISAHISVKQFFEGPVNRKRLLGVFKGIVNALLSAEDYMIDTRSIIIDLNYMFADVSTCDTVLVCLPIVGIEQEQVELGMFFKNIMFSTQFDQTDNCDYVAKIINYLNIASKFSLADFRDVLNSIDTDIYQKNVVSQTPQTVTRSDVRDPSVSQQTSQLQIGAVAKPSMANVQMKPEKQSLPIHQPTDVGIKPNISTTPKAKVSATPTQMSVPGQRNLSSGTVVPPAKQVGQEISWFYLMQHYNKENAAAYKAQKEAKKRAAAATKGKAPVQQTSPKKTMQASQVNAAASRSMNNPGFAIPGQPAPAPTQAPASNLAGQNRPATSQPGPAAFPRQAAPQQAYPQQAMPRQAAPQQAMPRQAAPQQAVPQQAMPQQAYPQQAMPRQSAQQPAYTSRPIPQGQTANFGETTVLGGAANGETTVLNMANNPAQMIAPHLIRKKSNEKISINKPVFRVGKERSYVDYFIGDNTAISRSHANFITRDGEYFVVDTNSTNHTFVNGRMIQSNVETKISHGDTVRLANEDFAFRMY